ncbi:MAG: hypothetical protein AAF184_18870 [Pseudomonadota bacterium]
MRFSARHAALVVALVTIQTTTTWAQAPDASERGPFATETGEYRMEAEIDDLVLAGQYTEVWARTYYPVDATGSLPTVVFMHGNRATCGSGANPRFDTSCEYTTSGTCPDGFVVTPSHEGFEYIAEPLASWGFVVVSINTNRGISCGSAGPDDIGLNKARGRLVLRHFQRLSEWNVGERELTGGFPEALRGRLDLSEVGLVGHSRGGEGVRAAYNFYADAQTGWQDRIVAPLNVKAIFELGGTDGQTDTEFNAAGTAWTQLLPMCDGDVFKLDGVKPLDRMLAANVESPLRAKSSFAVWGANHNFWNSAWETSDISSCVDQAPIFPPEIGSPEQQQIGRAAVMAMMRGTLGADASPSFLRNFNPAYAPPAVIADVTRVDRSYADAANRRLEFVVEDFSQATGINRYGFQNDYVGVDATHSTVPQHDLVQRAAEVSWTGASNDRYVQINMSAPGAGRDITRRRTLSFRIARQLGQADYSSLTDLSIALVNADGSLSDSRKLSEYLNLTGPVGTPFLRHTVMQTVRIGLTDFTGVDLTNFRGIRFVFDLPNPGQSADDGGSIYLANVNLASRRDRGTGAQPTTPAPAAIAFRPAPQAPPFSARLGAVRNVARSDWLSGRSAVEVEVLSDQGFPVTDALPTLSIGDAVSRHARYSADTRSLIFTFPDDALRAQTDTSALRLQLGAQALDLGALGSGQPR